MVDVRVHLIYRALVALDQEIAACGAAPSAPGQAVRFCLAFLYAARPDQKRLPYDDFWKELVFVDKSTWPDPSKRYRRQTALNACMTAIVRSLGLPTTPQLLQVISEGHRLGRAVDNVHVARFWEEVQRHAAH